jgi:hypothetical protein
MLSELSAFPLALRHTRVVFVLLKKSSSELETEARVIFTLPFKPISGETGTGSDSSARVFTLLNPHICWPSGLKASSLVTTSLPARRLCVDARCGSTCERHPIAHS